VTAGGFLTETEIIYWNIAIDICVAQEIQTSLW